jgi:hypothetical protein
MQLKAQWILRAIPAGCLAILCPWPLVAQLPACAPRPSLSLYTGTDAAGALLPLGGAGAQDSAWPLVAVVPPIGPQPRPSYAVATNPSWAPPFKGTQWISATVNNAIQGSADFYYQSCFCLKDPTGAQLALLMRADNQAFVYLNTTLAAAESSATTPTFTGAVNSSASASLPDEVILSDGFVAGQNCVIVKVHNFKGSPPSTGTVTGLDVGATLSAPGGIIPRLPNCACTLPPPPRCGLTGTITSACCLGSAPGKPGQNFHAFLASLTLTGITSCAPTVTGSPGTVVSYAPTTLAAGSNTVTGIYSGATPMSLTIGCGAGFLNGCSVTLTTDQGECAPKH